MLILEASTAAGTTVVGPPVDADIHVILQYFEHANPVRNAELQLALTLVCDNPCVTWVHLLNERVYEGLDHPKIRQHNVGARLRFKDVFQYLRENDVRGYHVIINSDISFDETLDNLRRSDLHLTKTMLAQLRYEVTTVTPTIFGPRCDSQDTWIFHSSQALPAKFEKLFAFQFGMPGCDNKLLYLMRILGYKVVNDPAFVKTYHHHASQDRNYTIKDRVPPPYALIGPHGYDMAAMAQPYLRVSNRRYDDVSFDDNKVLYEYVCRKLAAAECFVIPRIAGHENNVAVFGKIMEQQRLSDDLVTYIQRILPVMKNNAGIKLSSDASVVTYANRYLSAFAKCEMFAGWESQGTYINHVAQSHELLLSSFSNKKMCWAFAFDIFHYIYSTPWTWALRGKRILIISPFAESFREKLPIRAQLYDGVDLFPDCTFVFAKPPQTQGSEPSEEFDVELDRFLGSIKDLEYDVALVSCGGYGNLVCSAIYDSGRSAIYVGGVLQMYFGVLGTRWLKERPDVLRLFMNAGWSRPKPTERPRDFQRVEGSCYW